MPDNLAAVFRMKQYQWIDPGTTIVEGIIATIRKCPSAALNYSINDVEYRERSDSEPAITDTGEHGWERRICYIDMSGSQGIVSYLIRVPPYPCPNF